MATFYRPAQLVARMEARADAVVHSLQDAHMELVRGGIEDHARFTSGRVSSEELREMGHPFGRVVSGNRSTGARGVQNGATTKDLSAHARIKGNVIRKGMLAALPINKQTGDLRSSFFSTNPTGPAMIVDMGFHSDHAPYVLSPTGTRLMISRGFYSAGNSTSALGALARAHRARSVGILNSARKRYLFS